jgi:hypothetical protein
VAFKTMKTSKINDPPVRQWQPPNLAGGVVYTDLPMNLQDNQSPDMLNMWYKEKVLTKRYGQEYLAQEIGAPILSMYDKKFNGFMIFTSSTKMYKCDLSTGTVTQIYASLTASKGSFFTFKNKTTGVSNLYYINGHEFVKYDGTTVTTVKSSAYVPTVLMGRSPTGGGSVLEQYNALGSGFITSFSPNGSSTAYTLPQTNLDATTITCTLSGVAKVEGTDFTVNRTTGVITFTVAPIVGTDTLKVTAYKTSSTLANILACKYAITYGGNNDTRVFMAGDSTTYYYSGLQDPSYFPENQYNNAGVDNTFINGFGKMYGSLIVLKERSLGVVNYQVNNDGSNPSFSYSQMNSAIGCDMPYTIQNINNNLVWCNSYGGVYTLLSDTQIKDEKNVVPLSHNINGNAQRKGLLQELKTDLQNASSIDFYGMYWICIGAKVYAWDYNISPYINSGDLDADQVRLSWFLFNNIKANCWFGVDQNLYLGDTTGNIVHFKNNYTDFGSGINAYWQSKILHFGLFNWYKYILDLRYSTKTDAVTNVTTTYYADNGSRVDNTTDFVGSFNWATFNWTVFTWAVINYAKTFKKTVKIPQTNFFSVKFSNNEIGENLSILDLAITYIQTRLIK